MSDRFRALFRHPGLDPGSMNTRLGERAAAMFMDPDARLDGEERMTA